MRESGEGEGPRGLEMCGKMARTRVSSFKENGNHHWRWEVEEWMREVAGMCE